MNLVFHKFEPSVYDDLSSYFTHRTTENCESHFLYHVIWKDYYETKYTLLPTGSILWSQKIGDYKHAAILPVSTLDHMKSAFEALQDHFTEDLKKKLTLFLVDEDALDAISPDTLRYTVTEDVASFDYIYEADKLRALSGKTYHKKKNHVNGFLKAYPDRYVYKNLTHENTDDILDFSHRWMMAKISDDVYNRLESEKIGLTNVLSYIAEIAAEEASGTPLPQPQDIRMAGIYIDDQLEALAIGTYDPDRQMVAIHIEKANDEFRGIYAYINQQFLIQTFPEAVYVNREDDMGIESLRRAKESYYPLKLTKKYTIKEN